MKNKFALIAALCCCVSNALLAQNNHFIIAGSKPRPNAFAFTPTDIRYEPGEITAEQLTTIKKENPSLWLIADFSKDKQGTPPQVSIQDTETAFIFIPPKYQGSTLTLLDGNGLAIETLPVEGMLYTVFYAHLSKGDYFISITQAGKIIYQNKLVKVE
jgi:hypothetical protein